MAFEGVEEAIEYTEMLSQVNSAFADLMSHLASKERKFPCRMEEVRRAIRLVEQRWLIERIGQAGGSSKVDREEREPRSDRGSTSLAIIDLDRRIEIAH